MFNFQLDNFFLDRECPEFFEFLTIPRVYVVSHPAYTDIIGMNPSEVDPKCQLEVSNPKIHGSHKILETTKPTPWGSTRQLLYIHWSLKMISYKNLVNIYTPKLIICLCNILVNFELLQYCAFTQGLFYLIYHYYNLASPNKNSQLHPYETQIM